MTTNDNRTEHAQSGGRALTAVMRRLGWSSGDVARNTGGTVSASSVLAYQSGKTLPSPSSAIAVASTLTGPEVFELLRAWGYVETAEALEDAIPLTGELAAASSYSIDDSATPLLEVPLGWRISGTVIGKSKLVVGAVWYTVRLESGTLVRMNAYEYIEFTDPDASAATD